MRDDAKSLLTAAKELPPEQLPMLLGEIEVVRCTAIARLTATAPVQSCGSDELLGIEEAARRLGMSKDYLYRHSAEFHFTRRIGRKLLFSNAGINAYINRPDGLTARRQTATLISAVNHTARGKR
jgi:excisionase family DNA binding protein